MKPARKHNKVIEEVEQLIEDRLYELRRDDVPSDLILLMIEKIKNALSTLKMPESKE